MTDTHACNRHNTEPSLLHPCPPKPAHTPRPHPAHMMGVSMGSARLPACPMGIGSLAARWMGAGALPPSGSCAPTSKSTRTSLLALSAGCRSTITAPPAPPSKPPPLPLLLLLFSLSAKGAGRLGARLAPVGLPSESPPSKCSSGWSSGVGMWSKRSPPSAMMGLVQSIVVSSWVAGTEGACNALIGGGSAAAHAASSPQAGMRGRR